MFIVKVNKICPSTSSLFGEAWNEKGKHKSGIKCCVGVFFKPRHFVRSVSMHEV